jgi:hypothetical protein
MGRRGKLLDLPLFGKSGFPPRTPPSPTRQDLTNYQDNQHLLAGLQPLRKSGLMRVSPNRAFLLSNWNHSQKTKSHSSSLITDVS